MTMDFLIGKQLIQSPRTSRNLLLLSFLFYELTHYACVDGWTYSYSNTTMNWNEARKWCQTYYTDMVAIQNQDEIAYLNNIMPKQPKYYWIGIRKQNEVWTWVGTNKTLTKEAENWATGEPNNGKSAEDCVEMYIKRSKDAGKWNDEPCLRKKYPLCYTASCDPLSCSGNGECIEQINNHTCKCNEGFYGDKCENVVSCDSVEVPSEGFVSCSHPYGNFSYSSACEFSCQEGYHLTGSRNIQCTASKLWSSKPPVCEAVQCDTLETPSNGSLHCVHPLGNFSFNSTCEFACDKGYRLVGSSSLACGAAGQWSDLQPQCEAVKCSTLETPQHGNVICSHPNGEFSYNSSCQFSCAQGFELKGEANLTCTASTQWTGETPHCAAITCQSPEAVSHGAVQCSTPMESQHYNSSCQFSCEPGFVLEGAERLQCTASGLWSAHSPACKAVRCAVLSEDMVMNCSHPLEPFAYMSECHFHCPDGLLLNGSDIVRCDASGNWTGRFCHVKVPLRENDGLQINVGLDFLIGKQLIQSPRTSRNLLLLSFLFYELTHYACVDGWTYSYSNTTMNWNEARKWCQTYYTDMVAIQNQDEIAYLNNIMPKQPKYYWIGIRKQNEVWTWVGTNKTLTKEAENWATGEPNNGKSAEDCVEMYIKRSKDAGKWNDEPCLRKKYPLCYTASCDPLSCSGNGECIEQINNHTCKCNEGFYGDKCENVVSCDSVEVPSEGFVSCSHPYGNFSYSSACEFSCQEGYHLTGSRNIQCTASKLWSSKPPVCEAVQCDTLETPSNGSLHCVHPLGNFSFNSTCEFACDKGYRLVGSSSLACGAAGQWSDLQPQCEAVKCSTLETPQHGSVICSHPNGEFSYNSSCQFSCAQGFELKGEANLTCTASTQWTGETPHCAAITCQSPEAVSHGAVQCSTPMESQHYNSSCQFSCEPGFVLEGAERLQCTASGLWSAHSPACKAVRCAVLSEDMVMNCSHPLEPFAYMSECHFHCPDGLLLNGSDIVRCDASGNWTGAAPSCQEHQDSLVTYTLVGLAAGGSGLLSGLSLIAWILKRLRQKAKNFDLNRTLDDSPQTYKSSSDSLI
ncbi:E-selectin [Amia ocellicauda]|uniref:E-selectin n=1 Tax=Amia ocellicauda TaxID=2972642 RepID=UPI003464CB2E